MINNRQAGRRRGRNGNNNGGGASPRQGGGGGRLDTGNRIDNRARGNAAQLHEKYKNLARDAQLSGDRVNIEYYLQFADHYFRVLSESRSRFEDQPRRQQQDGFDDGFDADGDDYGDEGEPIRAGEQAGETGQRYDVQRNDNRNEQRGGGDTQRSDSQRGDRQRNDGPRGELRNDGQRSEAQRNDGQRNDGQRDGQRAARTWQDDRPQRADRDPGGERVERRPRNDGQRQPRADQADATDRVGADRVEADRNVAPVEAPMTQDFIAPVDAAPAEAPRRRGRPRRDAAAIAPQAAPASEAATFEADRLPPSLGVSAVVSDDGTPAEPKPRRRRTIRAVSPEAAAE